MADRNSEVAWLMLTAAAEIIEGITAGMAARGYADLRPAHGFAFVRIAEGDATTVDIADQLGVTKQAASQLVEQLVAGGYVVRRADKSDGRRKLLALTARGRRCTQAAEAAMSEVITSWRPALGATGIRDLRDLLGRLDLSGPLRPAW